LSRMRQEECTPRKNVEDSRTGGVGVRLEALKSISREVFHFYLTKQPSRSSDKTCTATEHHP
jgi:hypothetical protein